MSLTTNTNGVASPLQTFDPWGAVRSGTISSTEYNYTNQRKDAGTGLLFYNARYYDPALGRFLQADSIVPNTSHRSLTVDFHETGFVNAVAGENAQGFWFQMSGQQRQQATPPWGSSNPQELNRFSYVNNNPLRYADPDGHQTVLNDSTTWGGYSTVCNAKDGTHVACGQKGTSYGDVVKTNDGKILLYVWFKDENTGKKSLSTRLYDTGDASLMGFMEAVRQSRQSEPSVGVIGLSILGIVIGGLAVLACAGPQIVLCYAGGCLAGLSGVGGTLLELNKSSNGRQYYRNGREAFSYMTKGKPYRPGGSVRRYTRS